METAGVLILILVGCLHQPLMDWVLNHGQQSRKTCCEPAAPTLPPGNDVYVLLNCFPNYMVMGNVIAGWVMFRSNRGNICSPQWGGGGGWRAKKVQGCGMMHQKHRGQTGRLGNDVCFFAKAFLTNYMMAADPWSPVGCEQERSMDLTCKSSKCAVR